MRKFKTPLLVAACVAGVVALWLIVSLSLTALANRHRLNAFNDSDLMPTRAEVPAGSNAFWTLLQATNKLYWPRSLGSKLNDLSENTNWDDSLAAKVLAKNAACLDLFDQAMQKPFLQIPEPKSYDEIYPYLSEWRDISHLESIRTIALFRGKKEQAAFDEAFKILQFGQRVENCGGPILHYLVGASIKSLGLARIRQMTASTTLNQTELLHLLRQLDNFGPNKEGLTNALKVEYHVDCKMLDDFAAGKMAATNSSKRVAVSIGLKPLFNVTKAKMKFAEADRVLLDSFSMPYSNIQWSRLPTVNTNDSFLSILGQMVEGDAIGNMLYGLFEADLSIYPRAKSREDVNVTATQLLLALKTYKVRHGQLPASLSELVPEYFPRVPIDDFDGKPFRYLPDQKLIYSVGPDLKDSGGKGFHRNPKTYDLPFKIEF